MKIFHENSLNKEDHLELGEESNPDSYDENKSQKIDKISEEKDSPAIEKNCRNKMSKFFGNFKDLLILLFLLSSSMSNFSILNIPYTLCGIFYMFLIFNHKESTNKIKFRIEISILIYAILTLIFKTIITTLDKLEILNNFVEENKNLFLDLGLKYLEQDNYDFWLYLDTFLSDGLIILAVIISSLIKCFKLNQIDNQENESKNEKNKNNNISNYLLCLVSLVTLGITCANISFISIFYSILIHLGLFLWSINKSVTYNKILYFILSFLFVVHIILTHTFNIYELRKKYMVGSSDIKIIKWLGIMKMKSTVEYYFDFFLTVIGSCICVIAIKIRNEYVILIRENNSNNLNNLKNEDLQNSIKNNFWNDTKETLIKYVNSSYFLLHFCRLSIVYWTWRFSNYPTCGLLLWLCYSFIIINANRMKYVTMIIGWPCLIWAYNSFMLTNIEGFLDDYIDADNKDYMKQFALEKFDISLLEFIPIQLTILIFSVFMRLIYNEKIISNSENNNSQDLKENLLSYKIHTEENIIDEENSFSNLIFKLLITNIDKITLIFMYFIAIQEVNISHFILTFIFFIQLILPGLIRQICLAIIISISLIFSLEYILDITKLHITIDTDLDNILNLIFEFKKENVTTEFFLPFIIYCFYIQYQNYNSPMYINYMNNKITFNNYLEQNLLKNYQNIKSIINFSILLIQEIYIWIIFILLFLCICAFDLYLAFGIKLVLFSVVIYKYLNLSKSHIKGTKIIKYVWVLIYYCGFNTMFVYFYQFTVLKYISGWYDEMEKNWPEWLSKNLISIGLERYTKDRAVNFLPHYATNFLSVLLLWEIKRILDNKKEIINKDSNLNEMSNNIIVDVNKPIEKINYFKYYSYHFIIVICKTYWLFIFLSICIFITVYQLSLAMIIYIIIFSVSQFFMFNYLIKLVNKFVCKGKVFLISKIIRYSLIEKPRNIKILKRYRKITFKSLLFCGLTYIFLTYIYTVFDNIQNGEKNFPIVTEEIEEFIKSISYLVGVFHDFKSKSNFVTTIWGHLFMICLISFDIYIQKLQSKMIQKASEIQLQIKMNEKLEIQRKIQKKFKNIRGKSISRKISHEVDREEEDIKIGSFKSAVSQLNVEEIKNKSITNRVSNFENIKENNEIENEKLSPNFEQNLLSIPEHIKSNKLILKFLNIFKHLEENKENCMYAPISKSSSINISWKKAAEELISFLILLSAIIKLNIISLFYIFIVFYLQIKGKNLNRIFNISILITISIILQTFIFLSNLSTETDPIPNQEMSDLILKTLSIPWYKQNITSSWGFFFSLGVNYYQIKALWVEFIVIIWSFVYLDNFCYSIYEGEIKEKINYFKFTDKKSIKKSLNSITEEEYEEIRKNLKFNFKIDLVNLENLKQKVYSKNNYEYNDDRNSNNIKRIRGSDSNLDKKSVMSQIILKEKTKKSKCRIFIDLCKKTLYLTMHNLMLVITLILSMLNSGLISAFYIIFSLYYLFNSNNIVQAKPYTFPTKIEKFLRMFFLLDLFIQLLYQNPLNVDFKEYEYILISIGINKTIDYSKGPDSSQFNLKASILDAMKAVTYFFISIQVMIYNSTDFKEFYIGFILKKKDSTFRNSMINAFLFNNKRIKLMERSINRKKEIDKVLGELEGQLEKWSNKLAGEDKIKIEEQNIILEDENNNNNQIENINHIQTENQIQNLEINQEYELYDSQSTLNNQIEIKNKIKSKIMQGPIIGLATFIHQRTTNYSFIEKENKNELEDAIIKGQTFIKSRIEKKIDKFLEDLDIQEIQIDEFDKIIENEVYEELEEKIENNNENITDKLLNKKSMISKNTMSTIKPLKPSIEKIDIKKYNHILNNNLFKKYLTKFYLYKFIFWNLCKYMMDNFHYICFLLMLLNNFLYASLISLFWPIAVFGFGLVEYPRPRDKFWKVCRMYSSVILVIKFLVQFDFIENIPTLFNFISLLEKYKIGIEYYHETYSGGFLYYIIFDAILIFFLMMQEYILIARGLWNKIESDIENVEKANDRIFKANAENYQDEFSFEKFKEEILTKKNKFGKNKTMLIQNTFSQYYENMFTTVRNYKPGNDYYAYYTVAEMIILIFLIFFYTDMDQDNMFKIQGTSTIRQFSGTMVLIAFFHAIKAVIDRIIYLQQSRNNLKFDFVYYDKTTGEKISEGEIEKMGIQITNPSMIDKQLKDKNIDVVYYQKEETNYPLIFKYILQILILILSHIFIFFILPMTGNLNLQNTISCEINSSSTCNDFKYNWYIKLFYLIYCVYLFFSALQIKYGLLDMRDKSLLMRGDNIFYSSLFKGYKAIPFLYELKLTIDWTCTGTCLDLFKWLKFESVYDLVFITHCTKKEEQNVPIGKKINFINKILMGGSSFVILLAILLGPLLLFSTLNPTNQVNNVTGANVELSICFQQGARVFNNFTLFKNDFVESIQDMPSIPEIWNTYGYANSSKTKNFPMTQVQIVSMSDTSDTIWDIAGPHIQTIKDRLENYRNNSYKIYIGFKYNFQRPSPPDARDSVKKFDYPIYIPGVIDEEDFIKVFLDDIKFCNKTELILDNFYNPAMRLTSQSHPKVIWDNDVFLNLTVAVNFICDYNNGEVDYTKSYYTLKKKDPRDPRPALVFHTFSDKVSSTSTAYDVVTFYISFIIVIGRVIRGVISGEAEKIVFTEMPEPKSLVNLCEGIKISRYRFDFEREEYLYYILIDFMRSPEMLKLLTKSSLKKFEERKELNKKVE